MRPLSAFALVGACALAYIPASAGVTTDPRVPLIDLGTGTYAGFQGGLYENGTNVLPADHAADGLAAAAAVTPLDTTGTPSPSGKVVLLSIGASNQSDEWCGRALNCVSPASPSFMSSASANPSVNHTTLVIVNGAQRGANAPTWTSSTAAAYDTVKAQSLTPAGLTEAQVQVVWLKDADANPTVSLPDAGADAFKCETYLGAIARALKIRYPNLQVVFLSSRIYGGYSTSRQQPEPYAYETGFSVKWLIQAQIDQARTGTVVDARAGDLRQGTAAPWLAWGPYMWADGTNPRSDGLTWVRSDFENDGSHPAKGGRTKVANILLDFFVNSPYSTCWFTAAGC